MFSPFLGNNLASWRHTIVLFFDTPRTASMTSHPLGFLSRRSLLNSCFPCPCDLATRHAAVSQRAASQSAVHQDTKGLRHCCLSCRLSRCSAYKAPPQQRQKHNKNGSKQSTDDNQQPKTTLMTTMSASNIASLSIDSGIDEEDEATVKRTYSLSKHRQYCSTSPIC